MKEREFRRHGLKLLAAWAALIVLMLASLASAYVPLGPGNLLAGLGIAVAKAAIVAALFMHLARDARVLRFVGGVALATLALLFVLSGVDYATRPELRVPFQGTPR